MGSGSEVTGSFFAPPTLDAMPLPPPAPRQPLHSRVIEMRGYLRDDGLIDIDGHLVDHKAVDTQVDAGPLVQVGQPLHEMWIRLTVDLDLYVRDAVASTEAAPYGDCRSAPPSVAQVVGLNIGAGWVRAIKERLGGTRSCTHLTEMLVPMGTAAFQSIYPRLKNLTHVVDKTGRPTLIDSCMAMRSEGTVVLMRWPAHYTGPKKG